jgi:hypothetical protein
MIFIISHSLNHPSHPKLFDRLHWFRLHIFLRVLNGQQVRQRLWSPNVCSKLSDLMSHLIGVLLFSLTVQRFRTGRAGFTKYPLFLFLIQSFCYTGTSRRCWSRLKSKSSIFFLGFQKGIRPATSLVEERP